MKKASYLVFIVMFLLFALFTTSCSKKTTEPKTEETADMVFVSGGTFNNGISDVSISSFYIAKYETTQAEYQAVMGAWDSNPYNYSNTFGIGDNYPVYYVSRYNAIEYCNRKSIQEGLTPCYSCGSYGTNPSNWPPEWSFIYEIVISISCDWTANGYRLPTEMEWIFAAQGGNQSLGYTYSGSNDINEVAWYDSNSAASTHAVGTKAPNELGIYDMSGNVWEWNWDIDCAYPSGAQTNPHGATSALNCVLRGGSWNTEAKYCTISESRTSEDANFRHHQVGFRCVRVSP